MGTSGSAPDVTREDTRSVFSQLDEPCTPLATFEVAEKLECAERTAAQNLEALAEDGELRTREVDEQHRVWWRPEGHDGASEHSEWKEFGAFVSAVEDYAIFMLDPDGTVASWNEGAERIKGYTEDEIIGEHFSTFYTEDDTEDGVPEANLETAIEEGHAEDEGWRVRQDGSWFWADVVITAVRDADGVLQGFTKVTRDMTEQREYEQQLRREHDQTEKLLRTAPVAIAVQNAEGDTVMANQRAQEALGLSEEELIDRPDDTDEWQLYDGSGDLLAPDETPSARVLATGEPVSGEELAVDPPEGEEIQFRVNAAPLYDSDGAIERVITAGEDITELKKRERQLEQRKTELETQLSDILGRISDAFYALDEEWRFTLLNEQAAEVFERTEDELLGESVWEVFPGITDGVLWEEFHTAMETQEPANFEMYVEEIDAWLELNVYPSETGLSIYFHNITERKHREQRLEELVDELETSNERLEQFAYAASHDLQEPLRMVSSYLQLIERRYADDLDEDAEEFIDFAVDGADRMQDMIDGLLEYSRVDTRGDPFEPVDLDTVLADVREDLQIRIEETNADIEAESLPSVEGDPGQLRQVLQNLLDNAIEYSGDDPPRVDIAVERDENEWVISVRDEGIGIDSADADRVFEVFQSLHTPGDHSGTGIGLALCERIVERHGGDIWVDSEPGEGATFSFTLPVAGDRDE